MWPPANERFDFDFWAHQWLAWDERQRWRSSVSGAHPNCGHMQYCLFRQLVPHECVVK